jgi:polyisoprenoid-binding protein YceI
VSWRRAARQAARGFARPVAPAGAAVSSAGAAALAAGALALAASAPAQAEPVTYRLDPAHSFVHFEVLHFGTSTARGRFGPVQGTVVLDRRAQRGEVGLVVDTASVDTGLRIFDARLREADLLASADHPKAYFVASRFRFEGDRLAAVRGEFTLRGVSQPLELRARLFGCRSEGGREVCGGDFEAEVLRSSFGATFGLPFVADRVRIVVQVEGARE